MTREEYLRQLQKYLKRLPKEDYESAMAYFTEYFEEAGPEHEQEVMNELGTPKQAAGELLMNMLGAQEGKTSDGSKWDAPKQKRSMSAGSIFLIILLTLFAAPIGIPVAITAILLLFAAVLVVAAGALCVLVLGLCGVLMGAKLVATGAAALTLSPTGAAILFGSGLFCIGAGIVIAILLVCVCKWIFVGVIEGIRRLIVHRGGKRK